MTIDCNQYATFWEIVSQGDTLQSVLDHLPELPVDPRDFDSVLFAGCGSSYFLGQLVAHLWKTRLGIACQAFPSSEIILRPEACFEEDSRTLVFGLSRTGETPETVKALEIARDRQGFPVVPVTCYPDSTLAQVSARRLVFPELSEESTVMTRAFTGMLGAFLAWAGLTKEARKLPAVISASLDRNTEPVRRLAEKHYRRVFFLGSGPFLPIACESGLKWKEMTGTPADAVQIYEFRHGQQVLLGEDSLLWIFAGREDFPFLGEVLAEFRSKGAEVLLAGAALPDHLASSADHCLTQHCNLIGSDVEAAGLLHLTQLFAFFRNLQLGGNPDHPAGLSRVTTLPV